LAETFIPPASSHIAQAEYDHDTGDMTVTFQNGSNYTYHNVARSNWRGMQTAQSAGEYLHRHIKGRHSYTAG
jgi:hypothetical protein